METLYTLRHLPTGAYLHHNNGKGFKLLTAEKNAAQFTKERAERVIDAAAHCIPGELYKENVKTKEIDL